MNKLNKLSKWLSINDFKKESRMVDKIILAKVAQDISYRSERQMEQAREVVRERLRREGLEADESSMSHEVKKVIEGDTQSSKPTNKPQVEQEASLHELDERFSKWSTVGQRKGGGTNFNRVGDGKNNYRSAIPQQNTQFFVYLKSKYGIENIINLKADSGQGKYVEEAGLNYLNIPLGSRPPSDSQWAEIKVLLSGGNTLIHCRHGADRTGAVIAKWKVENNMLSPEEAYQEALSYGFKAADHPGYTGNSEDADPNKRLRSFILS